MSDKLKPPVIKWLREPLYDDDGVQALAGLDQFGREHGDPTPMSPPVGLSVGDGDQLHATLRKLLREERAAFAAAVAADGFETEDEANDFDVEGDVYPADPGLPWDGPFDLPDSPPPSPPESSPTAAPAAPAAAPAAAPEAPSAALPAAPVKAP